MPVEVVSLPSTETFLLPREGISASLPEGILIASFEEAAMQDNVDFLQEPPLPLFFASRLITRLKSQQVPRGEVQSGTNEEVCYKPRELLDFSNLYRQKSREWVWELRVWDNGRKNIKLDQA